MALKDIIKFENSFVSQGGIAPAVGTLNGTYEAGMIGQGYRSFRTGGELSYTPSDFGIDLNSNSWGFIIWAKPNKTSLDTLASRHELMNIGTYYDLGETDIYMGFHSGTAGQRSFTAGGVYENQVAKGGLSGKVFTDWTVQNWFLYGIWCDGTDFGQMMWNQVDGLTTYSRAITYDNITYPFQDKLMISGYDWDPDGWGGSVDELRIYDGPFSKKEFLDLARGGQIHYTFNTDQQTIENEFLDNWDDLTTGTAYGIGTYQPGAYDPFGMTTDNSVFQATGKIRFGVTNGTDIGTLYAGTEYTFSIYLRHVYNEEKMGAGEFDISDQNGKRSFSGSLGDNMSYTWKRFWTTASPVNASYHFIDIGTFSGSNVFQWCCPQIEQRVRYASDGLEYYQDTDLNVSKFTQGRTGIINDDSGNGNDVTLTYTNSPYYNSDASDGRKTSLFPGMAPKKIVLPVDNSTNIKNFSWACWAFQLDTSTQHNTPSQYIMSQGRDTGIYGANIYTYTGDIIGRYYGSGGVKTLGSVGTLLDGWHHLAMTYDISVGGKFYKDGVLADSDTAVGEIDYNNYNFVVGKMAHGETGSTTYFPFNGYIDDVRVYGSTLDDSAIMEIYQQKAYIDPDGNFGTQDFQETGHVPLIIDYTTWEVGTGGAPGFSINGGTDENSRVLGGDPWGNQDAIIWRAGSDVTSDADGGWNTSQFDIDNSSYYRFSTWVWKTNNGTPSGSFYLGCHGYGSTNGVYNRGTGSNSTNPYFVSSNSIPSAGRWELIVGHIWPVGSGTGSDHPESGRYTIGDGRIGDIDDGDWVWRAESTVSNHRSYLYYCTDTSTRQYWVYPRVDKIDGTEPSIEELLSGFDANYIDYIREKGGDSNINLDVGFSETHVGKLSEISVDTSLLLWYPLQGPYTSSGDAYEMVSGYDGTLTGDPSVMARGYYFDGTEDVDAGIGIDNIIGSTNVAELSFSAWVNRRASINDYNMIMGQLQPWLSFRSSNIFQFSAFISGTQRTVSTDTNTYTDGVWYHVVGTYDGDKQRIYIDGELAGTGPTYTGGITLNAGYNFFVGNWDGGVQYPHDGTISDVRVYNRALTAEEAQILYDTTNPEGTNSMKLEKGAMYLKGELKEI